MRLAFLALLLAAPLAGCALGEYSSLPGDGIASDAGSTGGTAVAGDLPCDVSGLLSGQCTACHGAPPTAGAPMSLTSLADLRAASAGQPSVSNAVLSLQRMQSTTAPMPPSPAARVSTSDVAAFGAWVDAGTPAGSCAPARDPVFDAVAACTSNTFWTGGDSGSARMHPGRACVSCHASRGGPSFPVGGTVYPTGHEPDDCNGSAATGAVVTVTDKNGTARDFTVDASGNFYGGGSGWPAFPITAKVTFAGKTRTMQGAVSSGDCDSCHTQGGASGAPGRIALP